MNKPNADLLKIPSDIPWRPFFWWVLAAFSMWLLFISNMHPLGDTDYWWHLAYARYYIENSTLIPDHTIFTWSPANGERIYCSWLGEVILYYLHQLGGLTASYIFLYFAKFTFILLILDFCRRRRILYNPVIWIIIFLSLIMSRTVSIPKPEILSYVFLSLLVWTWWRIKTSFQYGYLYCYLLPIIMLLWVNSHGGFMFGVFFGGLALLGELFNMFLRSEEGLDKRTRKHFFIAAVLCGLAIFVTPYFWDYPIYLLKGIFVENKYFGSRRTISAMARPFGTKRAILTYGIYMIAALLVLAVVFGPVISRSRFRKRYSVWVITLKLRKIDWTIILTNLGFAYAFTLFIRSTFYLVPVFAFSAVYLLSSINNGGLYRLGRKGLILLNSAAVLFVIFFACRTTYTSMVTNEWFNFSAGGASPMYEAEFIRKYFPDYRLGNDYDTGGYLIWALWPQMKVFIDPRFFPFEEWYPEYNRYLSGVNIEEGLKKYRADIWCIRYKLVNMINYLLPSKEWELACYGDSTAVFAKKGIMASVGLNKPTYLGSKARYIEKELTLVKFAIVANDYVTADQIMTDIESSFYRYFHRKAVRAYRQLVDGVLSYAKGNFQDAAASMESCREYFDSKGEVWYKKLLGRCYLFLAHQAWKKKDQEEAIALLKKVRKTDPNDLYALFNLASFKYHNQEYCGHLLTKFFEGVKKRGKKINPQIVTLAQLMLEGKYKGPQGMLIPPYPQNKQSGTASKPPLNLLRKTGNEVQP